MENITFEAREFKKIFTEFFEKKFDKLNVISIKVKNLKNDLLQSKHRVSFYFTYNGELTPKIIELIEENIEMYAMDYVDDYSVELDSEARAKHDNSSLSYGVINLNLDYKVSLNESDKSEPIFVKKFEKFINNLWKNNVERMIIKQIYKYRKLIKKDPAKGKDYLNDVYLNNKDLIDSNATNEFKTELSNLINQYKVDDQINELQDHTKYFNKKTEKLPSDASYIGESNKKRMKNKNLSLIKRMDDFFYIAENEHALSNWEAYKKEILKETNIKTWEEYSQVSSLNEEINTAVGLIRLHNLAPRAELFLQKENYLYRPTKDYCYKVGMIMNPYADKEGNIFFDNEDSARLYADGSRGKYEYIGKESLKESLELDECDCDDEAHIKPYEEWTEMKDTEILNEETTTADTAIPDMPIVKRIDEATFETSYKNDTPELVTKGNFEKKLMSFDPYKNASNVVKGSKTEVKKKFDCLFEKYSIKDHNLKEKKIDKFSVLIENNFKERKIVSFNKKDFAKFIFENKNVSNYIKEGKFDYFRYMNNQTFGSTHSLIKDYFDSKAK